MSEYTVIYWDRVNPMLAGPYRSQTCESPRPFEVPSGGSAEFTFGHITSGEAWPSGLPRLARTAAVPGIPNERWVPGTARSRVVLWFEQEDGRRIALCSQHSQERIRWSVNPVDWIQGLLSEAYVADWKRPITSRIPVANYSRFPRVLKAVAQAAIADPSKQRSKRVSFPQLPLDDLVEVIRKLCFSLCFKAQPETLALWPGGRQAAITLTHDVDTSWILGERRRSVLTQLVDAEASLGFRGAWYITANRLRTRRHAAALRCISEAHHELGPHGWNHDAKLSYLKPWRQERRMRRARQRFGDVGVRGVRTPWYCRSSQLFRILARHFSYDSSVPNVWTLDSSTSNSGCCTVFPYSPVDPLFELPLTLPPDTFADVREGYRMLRDVADAIIARGGVVVVILHPEQQLANESGLSHYFAFLRGLKEDYGERLWCATPYEIVARYQSSLERGRSSAPRSAASATRMAKVIAT